MLLREIVVIPELQRQGIVVAMHGVEVSVDWHG